MNEIVNELIKLGLDARLVSYPDAPKNKPYIRIGYWKQIPFDIFKRFDIHLLEDVLYDEDCGDLYSYYQK